MFSLSLNFVLAQLVGRWCFFCLTGDAHGELSEYVCICSTVSWLLVACVVGESGNAFTMTGRTVSFKFHVICAYFNDWLLYSSNSCSPGPRTEVVSMYDCSATTNCVVSFVVCFCRNQNNGNELKWVLSIGIQDGILQPRCWKHYVGTFVGLKASIFRFGAGNLQVTYVLSCQAGFKFYDCRRNQIAVCEGQRWIKLHTNCWAIKPCEACNLVRWAKQSSSKVLETVEDLDHLLSVNCKEYIVLTISEDLEFFKFAFPWV